MSSNESYLAGAILIDGANVLPVVRGLVKPEDFQVEAYRAVFTAAASLAADGEPVDPCSIKARAKRQGVELPNQLLTELMEIVPTCANAADYAHRVAEDARTRAIKELAARIQEDSSSSPDELLATLQREVEDIRGSITSGGCSVQPTPSTDSTIWSLKQEKGGTILSPLAFPGSTRS